MKISDTWMEVVLSIALIAAALLIRAQTIELRELRAEVKGMKAMQVQTPEPPAPAQRQTTESECAAWLFSADLKAAKARICAQPSK